MKWNRKVGVLLLSAINLSLAIFFVVNTAATSRPVNACHWESTSPTSWTRSWVASSATVLAQSSAFAALLISWASVALAAVTRFKAALVIHQFAFCGAVALLAATVQSVILDIGAKDGYMRAVDDFALSSAQKYLCPYPETPTSWTTAVLLSFFIAVVGIVSSTISSSMLRSLEGKSSLDYVRASWVWISGALAGGTKRVRSAAAVVVSPFASTRTNTLLIRRNRDVLFREIPWSDPEDEEKGVGDDDSASLVVRRVSDHQKFVTAVRQVLGAGGSEGEIVRMIKNGDILVESDLDISRLRCGDRLDVTFAHS